MEVLQGSGINVYHLTFTNNTELLFCLTKTGNKRYRKALGEICAIFTLGKASKFDQFYCFLGVFIQARGRPKRPDVPRAPGLGPGPAVPPGPWTY